MEQTIWKDIVGFEGSYQVSNTGLVRSLDRLNYIGRSLTGKTLAAGLNAEGYEQVNLYKDNMTFSRYVHRLVAEAFIAPVEGKHTVNHKDMDKSNNHTSNLEWASARDQLIHAIANGAKRGKGRRAVTITDKLTGEIMGFPSMRSVSIHMGFCLEWVAIQIQRRGSNQFTYNNLIIEVK